MDITGIISKPTPFLPCRGYKLWIEVHHHCSESLAVNSISPSHRKLLTRPTNKTSWPLENTAITHQSLDFHTGIWGWHTNADTIHLVTAHAVKHIKTISSLSLEDFKELEGKGGKKFHSFWSDHLKSSPPPARFLYNRFSSSGLEISVLQSTTKSSPLIFFNFHYPPPPTKTRLPAQNQGTS